MSIIPVDPVNLSFKGKLISVILCFFVILVIAWVSQQYNLDAAAPILIASMGASTVIVFIIPNSPLAQPWPLVGGQIVSTVIGVASAQMMPDAVFASAFAVGASVLAMLLLRCLHPPRAASALAPVLSGDSITSLGFSYVLTPVGLNVAVMLAMAFIINRWILQHEYPSKAWQSYGIKKINGTHIDPSPFVSISERDIELGLQDMDAFLDVTSTDLSKLLTSIQKHNFMRYTRPITCGDIMEGSIPSVEYGTDVEEAWKIMQNQNLKALPVIDKSRRVIGIITWHDFVKFINPDENLTFQEKLQVFIKRTPDITTNKPESVGHIMTARVTVMAENAHIVDLIPLMSPEKGHRQIPVVNSENRLTGMVSQASLIWAMYNEWLEFPKSKPR
jgi:CBS domain-containing membrane protein